MTARKILGYMAIIVLLLWIAAWCAGCNPAKRVLKNKDQFEQVGQAWAQANPCNNDTTYITAGRDSVVEYGNYERDYGDGVVVREDTNHGNGVSGAMQLPDETGGLAPCDTVYFTRTKRVTITDTINVLTRDPRMEDAIRKAHNRTRDSLGAAIILMNKYQTLSKTRGWLIAAMGGLFLLLILLAFFIYKYLKKAK
jgi:hypothetical protein